MIGYWQEVSTSTAKPLSSASDVKQYNKIGGITFGTFIDADSCSSQTIKKKSILYLKTFYSKVLL